MPYSLREYAESVDEDYELEEEKSFIERVKEILEHNYAEERERQLKSLFDRLGG